MVLGFSVCLENKTLVSRKQDIRNAKKAVVLEVENYSFFKIIYREGLLKLSFS
jgi:hypothetical protein